MHATLNKETGEIIAYKYLTPHLARDIGYNGRKLQREYGKHSSIETEKFIVHFDIGYKKGNRGGKRTKKWER